MLSEQENIRFNQVKIPVAAFGKGWMAVDKPCGLSIHNDPGNDLCSGILAFLNQNSPFTRQTGFDKNFGVNPINRIDRETSGIVFIGLNKETTAFFSRQFQQRSVDKIYVALVHGHPLSKNRDLLWDKPLSPKPGGRKNPAGTGKKQDCATLYRVLDSSAHYSLIQCRLLTGRKHQIRRHAKLNKTPVTGDKKYGSPKSLKYLEENCNFTRLGLHSLTLSVTAKDKSRLTISSEIPAEFIRMIRSDILPCGSAGGQTPCV